MTRERRTPRSSLVQAMVLPRHVEAEKGCRMLAGSSTSWRLGVRTSGTGPARAGEALRSERQSRVVHVTLFTRALEMCGVVEECEPAIAPRALHSHERDHG